MAEVMSQHWPAQAAATILLPYQGVIAALVAQKEEAMAGQLAGMEAAMAEEEAAMAGMEAAMAEEEAAMAGMELRQTWKLLWINSTGWRRGGGALLAYLWWHGVWQHLIKENRSQDIVIYLSIRYDLFIMISFSFLFTIPVHFHAL